MAITPKKIEGTERMYYDAATKTIYERMENGDFNPIRINGAALVRPTVGTVRTLLDGATATGPGAAAAIISPNIGFQAVADADAAAAFSAVVRIEVSIDGTNWMLIGSISLSGTGGVAETDGFTVSAANYAWVRANIESISGTGTAVTVVTV